MKVEFKDTCILIKDRTRSLWESVKHIDGDIYPTSLITVHRRLMALKDAVIYAEEKITEIKKQRELNLQAK